MTTSNRLRIKEEPGWFVAGQSVARALELLSDGAFRLFIWISVNAHRPSGQLETTHKDLVSALNKSRRSLSSYLEELEQKGVCRIRPATNQHARTTIEVVDGFWPYEKDPGSKTRINETGPDCSGGQSALLSTAEVSSYVDRVQEMFLKLGCGKGSFGTSDKEAAADLARSGVPIEVVCDALLVGEVRKYVSCLNNGDATPIGSLKYFSALIDELLTQPLEPGYRAYLKTKAREFTRQWSANRSTKTNADSAFVSTGT